MNSFTIRFTVRVNLYQTEIVTLRYKDVYMTAEEVIDIACKKGLYPRSELRWYSPTSILTAEWVRQ